MTVQIAVAVPFFYAVNGTTCGKNVFEIVRIIIIIIIIIIGFLDISLLDGPGFGSDVAHFFLSVQTGCSFFTSNVCKAWC